MLTIQNAVKIIKLIYVLKTEVQHNEVVREYSDVSKGREELGNRVDVWLASVENNLNTDQFEAAAEQS